jgi:hypothetical protein
MRLVVPYGATLTDAVALPVRFSVMSDGANVIDVAFV